MQTFFFSIHQIFGVSIQQATGSPSEEESPDTEDAMPKADVDEVIDIPNSKTLWEVIPKPDYAPEVCFVNTCNLHQNSLAKYIILTSLSSEIGRAHV